MRKTKIYYFAYGSNLSPDQMKKRCPHSTVVGVAKINNYRITSTGHSIRWNGGVSTITKSAGSEVWGIVYQLDKDCLFKLDGFEGVKYKRYIRQRITCHYLNGKKCIATVYTREPKRIIHTSRQYRSLILKWARYYEFPVSYQDKLKVAL